MELITFRGATRYPNFPKFRSNMQLRRRKFISPILSRGRRISSSAILAIDDQLTCLQILCLYNRLGQNWIGAIIGTAIRRLRATTEGSVAGTFISHDCDHNYCDQHTCDCYRNCECQNFRHFSSFSSLDIWFFPTFLGIKLWPHFSGVIVQTRVASTIRDRILCSSYTQC